MKKQCPILNSTSASQFHLHQKPQHLDERRFRKSLATHLKTSKSAIFNTNGDESTNRNLKACHKVLKAQAQGKLSHLHLTLEPFKLQENNLLFPTIKHFSSLSSLSLEFRDSFKNETLPKGISFTSLTSLKNLNHLHICFSLLIFDVERILKNLMKNVRKLNKLISFSFTLNNCPGFYSFDYITLLSNLTKMTQLRTLKLHLDTSEGNWGEDLGVFADNLPKLPFLTQIDLVFHGSWTVYEHSLLQLFKGFQNMKNLTDLATDFRGCYYQEDDTWVSGSILESLRCLVGTSVRKFSFGLFKNMSKVNLRELSTVLKELKLLQSLSLDLFTADERYSNEVLADFSSSVASLSSLSSLSIHFPTEKGNIFQIATPALKSLPNLVSLKLEFRFDYEANDEQYFLVLFASLKYLKSLKYLDLQVANQKKIRDTSLGTLAESLKELKLLRNLSLDFSSAGFITNRGTTALCHAIQQSLSTLFSLGLKFDSNENIDEKLVGQLAETLCSLPLLFFAELCFLGCFERTDCKEIFLALKGRKNIGEVRLSLPYSEENVREIYALEKIKNVISSNLF